MKNNEHIYIIKAYIIKAFLEHPDMTWVQTRRPSWSISMYAFLVFYKGKAFPSNEQREAEAIKDWKTD